MNWLWDTDKEKANIKSHKGITFNFASKVSNDILAIDKFDELPLLVFSFLAYIYTQLDIIGLYGEW